MTARDDALRADLRALADPERWENTLDDAWPREGGRSHIIRVLAQEVVAVLDAHEPATEPCGSFGCTLPAGHNMGQADIPENHATEPEAPRIEDVLIQHQRIPLFDGTGGQRCVGCDHLYGETDGSNSPRHAAHVAQAIREAGAR